MEITSHRAKLTPKQVRQIRKLYKKDRKRWSQSALAKMFQVSQSAISFLLNGTTYKRVSA